MQATALKGQRIAQWPQVQAAQPVFRPAAGYAAQAAFGAVVAQPPTLKGMAAMVAVAQPPAALVEAAPAGFGAATAAQPANRYHPPWGQ
eukprot:CAMPEP_0202380102 /NCGR_PEP_ID=MMETSP1127-20130417/27184_1 /ASSEMBLY_ACC=CAM_ASM_000462 /TAXON_ID=3047 /ORGANISM="Dunaliella tertiolecta, Strain CCMP1320" /LENGTH=88 /DNA_ID=CAMNT_0048978745 /DNA_START=986 /DNA_END=1252 /DNA_ORIENTATION=-